MSTKEEDFGKESKKPDYDKDKDNDKLEVKQQVKQKEYKYGSGMITVNACIDISINLHRSITLYCYQDNDLLL
jgi:hypothetical protein